MKITIKVENDQISYKATQTISFPEALQVLNSALLGMMNTTLATLLTHLQPEAKGDLYDMFNLAASRTLEQFAPEYELRPNLTAQAILEAENKIILEGRMANIEPGT